MPIIGIGAGFANSTGSILAASGSIGKNFVSMSLEDTASLGLSGSINTFTASINTVTSHTTSSYEFSHIENSLKFKFFGKVTKIWRNILLEITM